MRMFQQLLLNATFPARAGAGLRSWLCCFLGLFVSNICLAVVSGAQASSEDLAFFEREIRPILLDSCLECHSQAGKKVKGGLSLDSRASILAGGESGPAAIPGDPDASRLVIAVFGHDKDLQMPPKKKLAPAEQKALAEWVRRGLPDPRAGVAPVKKMPAMTLEEGRQFWSFRALANVAPPPVKHLDWVENSVDSFVVQKLEAAGLEFAPRADKRTLLRRVTYDLTGLPPTPAEMEAFLSDSGAGSFARVVDRLLASPRYGERWGRHWLDVVRYADTCGNASDYPVPQAHLYRNWVINAFNTDMPYDQFLREQIAGDLILEGSESDRHQRIIATGYLAIARRFAGKGGETHLTIEDTIDNLCRSVLGVSLACARCHNHKFDPFSMEDYYGLYGFFSSTRYPYPGAEGDSRQSDFVPLLAESDLEAVMKPHRNKIAAAEQNANQLEAEVAEILKTEADSPERKQKLIEKRAKVTAAKKELADLKAAPPVIRDAYAVVDAKESGDAKVQLRGDPKNLGAPVRRHFPAILGGMPLPEMAAGSGRLVLAGWMSSPDNHLAARVMVNRIWLNHFGKGIVQTSNDFGRQGKEPSHPELLDFLAAEFVRSGWSLKAMHRLILLSRSWQSSSSPSADALEKDAANELLSHFSRRRLDAEALRDSLLYVAEELDFDGVGEHPFPKRSTWSWTQHKPFSESYESSKRSVYLMQARLRKNAYLALFDGADTSASTGQRSSSITPLQALFALNDTLVHRCSEAFAVKWTGAGEFDARIQTAYQVAYGRAPVPGEVSRARDFITGYRKALALAPPPKEAKPLGRTQGANTSNPLEDLDLGPQGPDLSEKKAWSAFARALLASNEFLYID